MIKKSQSLPINTIAILILVLVAMVVITLFFTGTFSKGTTGANNVLDPTLDQTNQVGQLINNLSNRING
jgi:flagellar basal body-associated protein FliL